MSFRLIETPGRELAHATYTLAQAPVYFDRVQKLGAMHPCFKSPTFRFTNQSLVMLDNMNDFDLEQVLREIASLAYNPAPPESVANATNLLRRLWRCRYPFPNYHYLIEFSRSPTDGGLLIEEVLHDKNRTGLKVPTHQQPNALYYIERVTQDRYGDVKSKGDAKLLKFAWSEPVPTTSINTDHAAVNGMKNPLNKAAWLMGTHVDVAYPVAGCKSTRSSTIPPTATVCLARLPMWPSAFGTRLLRCPRCRAGKCGIWRNCF